MRSFVDGEKRTWSVAINVGSLERIKGLTGLDLTDLQKADPTQATEEGKRPAGVRLTTEPYLVANVLWAIVQPAAEKQSITKDQFLEALDGDAWASAFDAMAGDLVDFFLKTGRSHQAKALNAQLKALNAMVALAEKRIESLDVEKIAKEEFSKFVTSSPGSSGSTPSP